jgi:hypothetical protein
MEVELERTSLQSTRTRPRGSTSAAMLPAVIYIYRCFHHWCPRDELSNAGFAVSQSLLRSGIYTWAALISTVLAALTAGYFFGGFIADCTVSAAVLGVIVSLASLYLLALPSFADTVLEFVSDTHGRCLSGLE